VKVVKNKLAPPFTEVEFDVLYGEGISKSGDLLDLAVNDGILEKSGAWFSYGGERVGQGRENARNYLQEHPKLLEEIETRVLQKHGLTRNGKPVEAAAPQAQAASASGTTGQKAAAATGDSPKASADQSSKAADKSAADKSTDKDKAAASGKAGHSDEDAKRAAAAAAANRPRPRA
jgi:recombination protein RecA